MVRRALSLLPLVVLLGCSSTGGPDGGDQVGVDGGTRNDGVGDGGALDLTRAPDCPVEAAWLVELRGSVVDEEGAAVADAKVQTCVRTDTAQLLCLQPATTDEDGAFRVVVPENARCMVRATSRVILPLTDNATVYCPVVLPASEATLAVDVPYVLLSTTPATTLPPLGDASAERTVVFADGLEVSVVPEGIFAEDYAELAARRLAPDEVPDCVLRDAPDFEALYAFSPEGDIFGAGFDARIPNGTGLLPGTEVELYAQGGLHCELADDSVIEEGVWQQFGTGSVSGDGAVIEMTGGEALPCFNWLAYRAAP